MLPELDRLLVIRTDASDIKGDIQTVLEDCENAARDAQGKDPAILAETLIACAQLKSRLGRYQEAIQDAREALSYGNEDALSAEALNIIGICSSGSNDLDEAERAFSNAAQIHRQTGSKAGLGRVLHNLAGNVYLTQGKFNLALSAMEEAQAAWNEAGIAHWGLPWLRSYIYLTMGDPWRSRQSLDELVKMIEPATRIAGAYYFLWARLAIEDEEYDQAREYLRLGLRIATQTGVPELNIWIRIEQSRFYRKTEAIPTAREWAEDAVQFSRKLGSAYFEGVSLIELAQAAFESGDHLSAESSLEKSIHILTGVDAGYDLTYARYLRSLWSHTLKKPDASTAWCEATEAMLHGGYAFILEKEQEAAFPLIASHLHSENERARKLAEQLLQHLSKVTPLPLRIAGLGQFAVWKGRQLIPDRSWQRRKTGELFRFLLLQPKHTATKEVIIEALWPEHGLESGSSLLHQSTSALRRILEPDLPDKFPSRYLTYEGEKIALQLPPASVVDFEVFQQAMPLVVEAQNVDRLMETLRLYTGELFPADRYADWSEEVRARLNELYQEGLLAVAKVHFAKLQFADSLDCIRQLIKLDPWNEDAVLIGMKNYLEIGAAPHALRLYNQLSESLKAELGLLPRPDLRELAETIRNR